MLYSSENEAPTHLHKWGCLMTVAMALSRKVWVQQGAWQIYPHMYILFVGDPASGKSVAMDCAEKLVQDYTDIPICPDQITREALTKLMSEKCKQFTWDGKLHNYSGMNMFCDEFVTLLGTEPIRMIEFLTAVFSKTGDFEVSTKNKGVDLIRRPCLNLLGNLTPAYLSSMMSQNLITGGFSRRVIPILAGSRARDNPRPKETDAHREAKNRCVLYAKHLSTLVGPLTWEPEAEQFFDHWYTTRKGPQMRNENNDVMRQYYAAKDGMLLKVAISLSLMEKSDMTLRKTSLEEALKWLDELEADRLTIFGGGGRNDLAVITRTIQRFICGTPHGVPLKLLKATFMNDAKDVEITQIVQHLKDTDCIVCKQKVIGGFSVDFYYPPPL